MSASKMAIAKWGDDSWTISFVQFFPSDMLDEDVARVMKKQLEQDARNARIRRGRLKVVVIHEGETS